MSTNTALDQIKARVEGLSNLCPEYMHLAIRNSVRNCDFDCQAHGEEEDCGPGQSDGARIAHSLADVPKLLAALEAVEALHYADAEVDGLYPQACSEGPCEHEDDCPEVTITPCYECSTPGWDYVAWPCPTIKAITEALR